MNYYRVTSNDYPQLVDITSSPTTVYLRKNVASQEVTDVETGSTHTEYRYDEAAISKDEYITLLHEQIADVEEVLADMLYGGDE